MSTEEKGKVSPQNQIPIDKDKLEEEHKAELKAATETYKQRCLLSFSTNRSGEVIKKYDFLTLPPYDESQNEDRMVHFDESSNRVSFHESCSDHGLFCSQCCAQDTARFGDAWLRGTGLSAG